MPAQEPPKEDLQTLPETLPASHQTKYLTAFSTVSAKSGRSGTGRRTGQSTQSGPFGSDNARGSLRDRLTYFAARAAAVSANRSAFQARKSSTGWIAGTSPIVRSMSSTNSGANMALLRLQVTRCPGNENIRFQFVSNSRNTSSPGVLLYIGRNRPLSRTIIR